MFAFKSVAAFETEARAAMADAEAAGFFAVGWTCEELVEEVGERAADPQDIREVISTCCSLAKAHRSAGWASDLGITRQALDQAIHRVLCGRSVFSR